MTPHETPNERSYKLARIALIGVIMLAIYCVGGDVAAWVPAVASIGP